MNTTRLYESNLDSPHNLPYRDLAFGIQDIRTIIGTPSTALNLMRGAFVKNDYVRAGVLAIRVMEMEMWDHSSIFVIDAYSMLRRLVRLTGINSVDPSDVSPEQSETAKSLDGFMEVARERFISAGMSHQELIQLEDALDK